MLLFMFCALSKISDIVQFNLNTKLNGYKVRNALSKYIFSWPGQSRDLADKDLYTCSITYLFQSFGND